ncbi:4041_t:CDS:2 [Ambispora gerdemannii]|uniref:4041_t:CDS:1 n=1 Tax=Ambispora gerdemannii TaxID=144530 RepID=A0A9N8YXN1_9GLOM|nr:4041_t:CDS:2 [Ambispora gerdemannii]
MVFLVVLDHTKIWLSIATALSLNYLRDFHVIYTILGALITTIIAKILKLIIRQPRPNRSLPPTTNGSLNSSDNKDDKNPLVKLNHYGMPSTHSSSIMFFATYIALHLFAKNLDFSATLTILVILVMTALSVVWSRVELGHHTREQVLAGMTDLGGKLGWREIQIFAESVTG